MHLLVHIVVDIVIIGLLIAVVALGAQLVMTLALAIIIAPFAGIAMVIHKLRTGSW